MQPPTVRNEIIRLIRAAGQPMKVEELASKIGVKYQNVMHSAVRAVASGDLVKVGPAEYGLTGVNYGVRQRDVVSNKAPRVKRVENKDAELPPKQAGKGTPATPSSLSWLKKRVAS